MKQNELTKQNFGKCRTQAHVRNYNKLWGQVCGCTVRPLRECLWDKLNDPICQTTHWEVCEKIIRMINYE